MKIGNQLKFGSAVLIFALGITISCTRSISVPVSPNIPQGNNNTATSTFTITFTATLTATATGANTATPTSTPTTTPTWTASPTGQATFTNTPTGTPTSTTTSTGTSTPTSTPTINPDTIADFEEGNLNDVTTNGLGLTGSSFGVTDTLGSTGVTALASGGTSGCAAGSYVSFGGTTAGSGSTYSELEGSFLNLSAVYNITTHAPAGTNAFVFCIKGTAPGNQVWFSVSDAATTQSSATAGQYVPISASWSSVTVCFNHMQSPSWAPASITGHMFDPTTAMDFAWEVTANSSTFNIDVDNFQFAQVGGGACPAFTATPTPNYLLIDDFENTGTAPSDSTTQIYTVQDQNGHWRDGAVFFYTDTTNGSSATTAIGAGDPGNALQFSGSLAVQGSYAGVGVNFTNPTGTYNAGVSYYDATVGGTYTGIRFDIKANSLPATNCSNTQVVVVDYVDFTAGVTTDHKIAVPVTQTAWQGVTVFYNQVLDVNGVNLHPVSMYQMQFQPESNGVSMYAYNFSVDNMQFVTGGPGTPIGPRGATIVDDMENGSNQIEYSTGSSVPGYLYDYQGSNASDAMCPFNQAFFLSSPGYNVQDIQGVPSMAIHYSGTIGDYGGMGWWFTNGNAYTNISAYTQLVFYAKSSSSSSFTITFNDAESVNCYGGSVNTYSPMTTGPAWAATTLTYNPSNGAYQFSTCTITAPSGGVTTNGCTGATNYASHQFDPTQAANIQFEPSGTFDLWLDQVHLQ